MLYRAICAAAACGAAAATWQHRDGDLTDAQRRATTLELTFGVRHSDDRVALLEKELLRRSSPSSPLYGQWLSNERVHEIVAPLAADVTVVEDYLLSHGVKDLEYSPNKDWIVASVTVDQAEQLLGAKYATWTHSEAGLSVTRLHPEHSIHLPARVAAAVAIVEPTTRMPPVAKWLTTEDAGTEEAPSVGANTPTTLRDLYNVKDVGKGVATNPTGHAVTAFIKQFYSANDFRSFWKDFGERTTGVSLPPIDLVGDATTGRGGVESMLDIEYINAMGAGIKSSFWGFSGVAPDNKENEPFTKWLVQMTQTPDATIPKIFSTSYGEDEASTTLAVATRMNVEFMKAGARGISLMFASGDEGANCKGGAYVPEWPSSSPYVTAVGGTTRFGNSKHERAAGLSSGGFSARWPMPAYMTDAVNKYIAQGARVHGFPDASLYNISGRAYPDVAAQATGYTVFCNGFPIPGVAGTSCASPTFSGVIALLVDRRLAAGKTPLGFLNPLLYDTKDGLAGALNDIVEGSSGGCAFGKGAAGWPALEGWDAVTGYGTPDYGKMLDVVMALP